MSGLLIDRAGWGARPARPGTPRHLSEVDTCFIHYSDTHENIPPPSVAGDAVTVRAIQADHMDRRGFVDIAYEALVGARGDIFFGRSPDIADASTCNNNRNGFGICVLTDGPITVAQQFSVRYCIALGHLAFPNLARTPKPHSAACATACPGDPIRAWMKGVAW